MTRVIVIHIFLTNDLSNSRKAEIAKMEADIRRLQRRRDGDNSDDEPAKKKTKNKSYLEEELAKYSKGRGLNKKGKDGKKKDEGDVLAALNSFRNKLKGSNLDMREDEPRRSGDEDEEVTPKQNQGEEDPGIEVDDDQGFLGHALRFPTDDGEESKKAERDYEVIDPRQRGARAREEERERKRMMKAKGGGGRHYRR
jgi:peptidyl-prolyl cis-trans isomerase SDCCAG10